MLPIRCPIAGTFSTKESKSALPRIRTVESHPNSFLSAYAREVALESIVFARKRLSEDGDQFS